MPQYDIPEFSKGNNKLFNLLKEDIQKRLKWHKIEESQVLFVSLTQDYWISLEEFLKLTRIPAIWNNESFQTEQFGSWILPKGFKIVLKDYSILRYWFSWGDPFYSEWQLIPGTKRPPKKYHENRPRNITLGDYIKK